MVGTNVDITHYTASEHGNTLPRLLVQYLYIDIEAGEGGKREERREGRGKRGRGGGREERWREVGKRGR